MRRSAITLYSTLALVALLVTIATIDIYRTFVKDNISPESATDGVVKIDKYADYLQTCDIIVGSGVLKNPKTFLRCAKVFNLKVKFHPGYYVLTPGMSNRDIVRTLAFGLQKPVDIVIGNNLKTLEQLSASLSSQIDCDSLSIITALKDSSTIARYGFTLQTFPGMFIPNTYEVYWTITPDNLLTRLYREYEKFWKADREEKAEAMGLSRNEVSTLASIVVEETRCIDEMPTVAGVYVNRLRKGIPLQADPTVKFAVGNPNLTRILKSHLQIDSPYNTYKYAGLPPGPVAIAPISAIDAVLNYQQHDFLYFCARPTFDGRHSFSKSYQQHLSNAARYHASLEELLKRKKAVADSLARVEADSLAALAALETSTSSQEGQSQESSSPSQAPKQ